MVKNLFSYINIYCTGHKDPILMIPDGNHPRYICPKCYPVSEENPNGYTDFKCDNVISFENYIKLVEKFEDIVKSDAEDRDEVNYKGMRIVYKGVKGTVLKHTDKHIDIGISPEG